MAVSSSSEMLRGLVVGQNLVSLQIDIGTPAPDIEPHVVARPVDDRDLLRSDLVLCQLRGRTLPFAISTFAETLMAEMNTVRDNAPG